MKFSDLLKEALPWIGAAATGNVPALISMAAKEVSGVLGIEVPANAEAIGQAVAKASPEQMITLRDREMAFKERMQAAGFKHQDDMAARDIEAARHMTERAAILEGTASDLKSMPVLGSIMLFARGAQRPIWGFGTLYIDLMVFSGDWQLQEGAVESAFWIVNLLVLGFLFGERAVQNIAPFVSEMLKARSGR